MLVGDTALVHLSLSIDSRVSGGANSPAFLFRSALELKYINPLLSEDTTRMFMYRDSIPRMGFG
jgi:hypothetical protein